MAELLNWQQMFRRVAREIGAGDVVALGTGLPGRLPGTGPEELGAWFLEESGAVGVQGGDHAGGPGIPPKLLPGGSYVGTADIGAIVRGGHVDLAVLEVSRVDTSGRFVLPWQALGLDAAPGFDADFAGARRVVGVSQGILLPASAGQSPTLAADLTREDGYGETSIEDGCLELLVTDCCVIQLTPQGLELIELAPGWTADEIAGLHNVVLSISPNLREDGLRAVAAPTVAQQGLFDCGGRGTRCPERGGGQPRRFRRSRRDGPLLDDGPARPRGYRPYRN